MANISGRRFVPFRIPAGWKEEERSLVRQIQDLFDRVFHRLHRTVRFTKTYTGVVIPSNGYVKLDSIDDFAAPISRSWWLTGMFIRGWTGATLPISLVVGSNGIDIYLTGAPQTVASLNVAYTLMDGIDGSIVPSA